MLLALVAGVPAGGLLGDLVGWRGVFLGLAGLAVAVGALAARLPERRPARLHGVRPSLRAALAVPGVPRLLVVCVAMMAGFYGAYGYLGAYVRALAPRLERA